MNTFQRVSAAVNVVVQPLIGAPIVGKLLGRSMTVITYVGRKSGRTFSAPVSYKRKGDHVTIGVAMPDKKSWWRNFYPEQGPIVLQLDGIDRPGEALAHRKARVSTSPSNSLPSTERIEQPPVQSHSAHTHRLTRSG
ncbi:hypothetical protein ACETU7_30575 [Rhodococcus sp. 3Y1]